jgi:nucleoid DNA-binding protein
MKYTPTMSFTKSHLIEAIAEQKGFIKKQSTETVEATLEIIKSTPAGNQSFFRPKKCCDIVKKI